VLVSAFLAPARQHEDFRLIRSIFYAYKIAEIDAGAEGRELAIPDGLYRYLSAQDADALKSKLGQEAIHFEISVADPRAAPIGDEVLLTSRDSTGKPIALSVDGAVQYTRR
jgi:hypothetical protein